MPYPVVGVFLGFMLTALWFAVLLLLDLYSGLRNPAVVTCPSVGADAAVRLHPAGDRLLRVSSCSRWPAHRGCDQACMHGIKQPGAPATYQLRS